MAIIFILVMLLILAYFSVQHDKENIQYTFDNIHYLGGHPKFNASTVQYGALYIYEKNITFWDREKNEDLFEIPIQELKNCTIETKESLTTGTVVGKFASALKKERQYISIEYKNRFCGFKNVIFYSPITPPEPIIQAINETRTRYIKNIRFERGEV